ncbi:hypothetical protein ACFLW2_00355 [Chloroflexota bacterium]
MKRKLILAFLFGMVLMVTNACQPTWSLTFENQKDQSLTIFVREYGKETWHETGGISPKETRRMEIYPNKYVTSFIEARDASGKVLYSEEFTWEELEERDFKIVIPPLEE